MGAAAALGAALFWAATNLVLREQLNKSGGATAQTWRTVVSTLIFGVVFGTCVLLAIVRGVWVAVIIFAAFATWIMMFVFTTRIDVSDHEVSFSRYFRRRFIVPLAGAQVSQIRIGDLKLEPALLIASEGLTGMIPLGLLAGKDSTRLRELIVTRTAR